MVDLVLVLGKKRFGESEEENIEAFSEILRVVSSVV